MASAEHGGFSTRLLSWTGHPLVDVGIATLCAMAGKSGPNQLTLEDLDAAAGEMGEYYFSGAMTSYLTCVFLNAEYTQPSEKNKRERVRAYTEQVLLAHRRAGDREAGGLSCVFTGGPATRLIDRRHMPMLTGEGILNFFPGCTGGLPISGPYLTALQALPLGGRRMEGRLLIANSDHPALTVAIARRFLDDNRRLLAMAKAGRLPGAEGFDEALPRELASWDAKKKHPKYPDAKGVRSIILSELMEIWGQRSLSVDELGMASLTVYWLTNSGQGPAVDIFQLPSNLLRFLALADGGVTRGEWRRRVAGAWLPLEEHPGGAGRSHNRVLTDLLRIYEAGFIDLSAAGEFVRRHLLAKVEARIGEDGHDRWALTYLFLKEVMGMDERRVEAIRTFADRLAAYIQERNDRPFFRSIIYAGKPADLRMSFVKAQRDEARKNGRLLFGLDEYIQVFEAEDNLGRLDWRLVRDLLSVRVVEQLHRAGFLAKEDLEEPEETVSQTEEG